MASVYVETSVVSHAASRPTSDPTLASLRKQARDWWRIERPKFEIVASQLVLNEAAAGDPGAAIERLRLLAGIPLVPITDEVQEIAAELTAAAMIPFNAAADALHVAAAASAGVEYLLTQNCRHIANAHFLPRIYAKLSELGCSALLICTPAEFLGDAYDAEEPNS